VSSRSAALPFALAALAFAAACASDRPWKVDPEEQRHFDQSREACETLTDDPAAFEKCMERRGWRRERVFGL
jgi:hypothetical protein